MAGEGVKKVKKVKGEEEPLKGEKVASFQLLTF